MSRISPADIMLAPSITGAGTGTRIQQRLTGTTSQATTELEEGTYATLMNSSNASIAVRFTAASSTAVTTDMNLAAGARFDWDVDGNSKFVAAIAADGTSTFTCWVWTSGVRGA